MTQSERHSIAGLLGNLRRALIILSDYKDTHFYIPRTALKSFITEATYEIVAAIQKCEKVCPKDEEECHEKTEENK